MGDVVLPNFRFRIEWDGKPVVRVQKVSGLKRTVAVTEHRDGSAPGETRKSPGHVTYHPLTFERALTSDPRFRELADAVADVASGETLRSNVMIEIHDETGQTVLVCTLLGAWVSSYEVFGELNVQTDTAAIERVIVEYDRWSITVPQHTPGNASTYVPTE